MTPKSDLPIISLFSGAGGMDLGFERAGFRVAVAVELDPSCCKTLRLNRPQTPVLEGDLSAFTTSEILRVAGVEVGEAALVIGGPPCQSFSLAGKRMGMNDKRGQLLLEFVRVVREALPKAFVLENVRGMLNWQGGQAIQAVVNEFSPPIQRGEREYRYQVTHDVLDAAEYGVPQHRERLFLVGNRLEKEFVFPLPTHGGPREQGSLFERALEPMKTVWDAIGRLPPADEPSETAKRVSQTIKERIERHGY